MASGSLDSWAKESTSISLASCFGMAIGCEIGRLAESLGSPLRIKAEIYDERWNPDDTVHFSRIQSFLKNSSALTHEGSHVIDYASLWNGSPWTSVSAFAQQTSPSFRGPNIWNTHVELADLSTLTVKVGWLLPDLPPSVISVEGPAGAIHFNCVTGEGDYQVESKHRPLAFRPTAPEWERQYDAFAAAIERGYAISATVNDALRALEVTTAGDFRPVRASVSPEPTVSSHGRSACSMQAMTRQPSSATPFPSNPAGAVECAVHHRHEHHS